MKDAVLPFKVGESKVYPHSPNWGWTRIRDADGKNVCTIEANGNHRTLAEWFVRLANKDT